MSCRWTAQHLLQAVGPLAPENFHCLIERLEIVVLAGHAEVADADFGLHRIGPVDDDHALGGFGRRNRFEFWQIPGRPVAEILLDAGHRIRRRDVADDRHQRIVGNEVTLVELHEVRTRERLQRLRRARAREAVGVEAEDEPIDHEPGHRFRIFCGDLQRGQRLLPLALDLGLEEGRAPHDLGHQRQSGLIVVLHDDGVDEAEVGPGARAEDAADVVDVIGDLLRGAAAGALVQQRRGEHGQPQFALRVLRRAGADDQPDAHGRLFVLADQHHGEPVRELLDLEGRKRDRVRLERPRRELTWPGRTRLRAGEGRGEQDRQHEHDGCRVGPHWTTSAPRDAAPFGMMWITTRLSGVK